MSSKEIGELQQRTSLLLSNLDFYTNELTSELESKIKSLENVNSIISYSYDQQNQSLNNVSSKLKPTTRLEYYIDSLSISINSLNDEVLSINKEISEQTATPSTTESPTDKLLKLTKSKDNLKQVLNSLETVKSIIDIAVSEPTIPTRAAPTSTSKKSRVEVPTIKPNDFQSALNVLKETIIEQFNSKLTGKDSESSKIIDYDFLKKVDSLIELLPIFKNLGPFHNNYDQFVNFLEIEKKNYLNSKDLDDINDDDELFKKILQK